MMLIEKLLNGKPRSKPADDTCIRDSHDERMVIRRQLADGSVHYEVTDALMRQAAKAASRKRLEAA
jgi:hypothetical protein